MMYNPNVYTLDVAGMMAGGVDLSRFDLINKQNSRVIKKKQTNYRFRQWCLNCQDLFCFWS